MYESGEVMWTPPGWPNEVAPPGTERWERDASAFLLDCCPPSARDYPVVRRYPIVAARFATACLEGWLQAHHDDLPRLRVALSDHVSPEVVQQAVDAWTSQSARLLRRRREVNLITAALQGEVFRPRL